MLSNELFKFCVINGTAGGGENEKEEKLQNILRGLRLGACSESFDCCKVS